MQVVARTDEYTIYKRRDARYAVKARSGGWINGDEKVAVLRTHDLIKAPAPKAEPEPEAAEPETEAAAEAPEAEEAAPEDGEAEKSED